MRTHAPLLLAATLLAPLPARAAFFDLPRAPDAVVDFLEAYDCTTVTLHDAGDVNGDGLGDVVARCAHHGNTLLVALIQGSLDGHEVTLAFITGSGFPAGGGDVNGDGLDDLAFYGEDGALHVLPGAAGGLDLDRPWTLDRSLDLNPGDPIVMPGDVDGDGLDDLVVTAGDGDLLLFRGSPDGPVSAGGSNCRYGEPTFLGSAGDVDGDGRVEVLCQAEDHLWLVPGSAEGLAAAVPLFAPWGDDQTDYVLAAGADLDGDGDPDLAFGRAREASAQIAPAQDGEFLEASIRRLPGSASAFGTAISAGDLDGDGIAELVVGAPGDADGLHGQVWVFPGGPGGPGALLPVVLRGEHGAALGGTVAVAGDLDGDGFRDLLAVDARARIHVWYGGGDTDGDGRGWASDCDDGDPSVHPGAAETCDDRDDDCDGRVDEECTEPPPPHRGAVLGLLGLGTLLGARRRKGAALLGGMLLLGGCTPAPEGGTDTPPVDDDSPWTAAPGFVFTGRDGGRAGLGVSAGDLDGDGRAEILVAEQHDLDSCPEITGCASAWLLAAPLESGTLAEASTAWFTASSEAITSGEYRLERDMAFPGDLTGDGTPDILFLADRWPDLDPDRDPDGRAILLWSGPFSGEVSREAAVAMLDPQPGVDDHAPCDVDGDGQADLCTNGGLVRGPFRGVAYAHHLECDFRNACFWYDFGVSAFVEAGDVLGEGRSAMVTLRGTSDWEDGAVYTLAVRGAADDPCAIQSHSTYPYDGYTPEDWRTRHAVVDGDLDGDGREDVLLVGSLEGRRHVAVLTDVATQVVGSAPITFTSTRASGERESALLADFDGDGHLDLAWGTSRGWVAVFRGPFAPGAYAEAAADVVLIGDEEPVCHGAECTTTDRFGTALAAGDVDGDGRADLVIGAPVAAPGRIHVVPGGGL